MHLVGRPNVANIDLKFGSVMKEMRAAGRSFLQSARRAFIRDKFLLSLDWMICSFSIETRSTPSGTGYSCSSTKEVTRMLRYPA